MLIPSQQAIASAIERLDKRGFEELAVLYAEMMYPDLFRELRIAGQSVGGEPVARPPDARSARQVPLGQSNVSQRPPAGYCLARQSMIFTTLAFHWGSHVPTHCRNRLRASASFRTSSDPDTTRSQTRWT